MAGCVKEVKRNEGSTPIKPPALVLDNHRRATHLQLNEGHGYYAKRVGHLPPLVT